MKGRRRRGKQMNRTQGLPRLMILSSALPGSRHGGGVVQDEILKRYPKDRYICVAARQPEGWKPGEELPESLRGVPCLVGGLVPHGGRRGARFYMPALRAFGFRCVAPWRVRQAVAFGRCHGVELVWAELQGDALLLARQVADGLGVPFVGTVWDDPAGWFADGSHDWLSRKLLWRLFRDSLPAARALSTAGEAMQRAYEEEYGVRSVVLRHGFDAPVSPPPARETTDGVVVGFVGSPYGRDAWDAFLGALARLNASHRFPPTRVCAFGAGTVPRGQDGVRIERRGWQPAHVMLREIAQTDFCYLPYWFEPAKRRHVELSFPNKFETYLAAGRPILFHGPAYAGVAEAVRQYGVGLCVHSLDQDEIVAALERLATDSALRSSLSRAALAAFRAEFNARVMLEQFAELIGVDPALLNDSSKTSDSGTGCHE